MANEGFTTATDFADYLVKEKGETFRKSYEISSKLVNFAEKKNKTLDQISLGELRRFYKDLDKEVLKIFNLNNSVNSKKSYGGTSTKNVKKMLVKYRREIK